MFLFAAISMTYLLVTLIHLSTEEDTAFLTSTNYRQQVRYATITTSLGNFTIAFMRSQAPVTTKYFLKLAQSGFYEQTKFYHFPGGVFVESGLAPDLSSTEGSVKYIFKENVETNQMMRSFVAMPRREGVNIDPRLILFFSEDEQPITSGAYAAFGRVVDGMEIVDKINGISPKINAGIPASVKIISISTD